MCRGRTSLDLDAAGGRGSRRRDGRDGDGASDLGWAYPHSVFVAGELSADEWKLRCCNSDEIHHLGICVEGIVAADEVEQAGI